MTQQSLGLYFYYVPARQLQEKNRQTAAWCTFHISLFVDLFSNKMFIYSLFLCNAIYRKQPTPSVTRYAISIHVTVAPIGSDEDDLKVEWGLSHIVTLSSP